MTDIVSNLALAFMWTAFSVSHAILAVRTLQKRVKRA